MTRWPHIALLLRGLLSEERSRTWDRTAQDGDGIQSWADPGGGDVARMVKECHKMPQTKKTQGLRIFIGGINMV